MSPFSLRRILNSIGFNLGVLAAEVIGLRGMSPASGEWWLSLLLIAFFTGRLVTLVDQRLRARDEVAALLSLAEPAYAYALAQRGEPPTAITLPVPPDAYRRNVWLQVHGLLPVEMSRPVQRACETIAQRLDVERVALSVDDENRSVTLHLLASRPTAPDQPAA